MTTSTGFPIPTICGTNDGQHMYIDVGPEEGATAMIQFDFDSDGSSIEREWEIKVSQIPCGASYKAPDGCLQYFTGVSGTMKTFNYDGAEKQHLGLQSYSACVRQEAGMCCIEYRPCPEDVDSFSLWTDGADIEQPENSAFQETECTLDYIIIEGGSYACVNPNPLTVNRFCGTRLSTAPEDLIFHAPICDCSAPFSVQIVTDDAADDGDNTGGGSNGDHQSRGNH